MADSFIVQGGGRLDGTVHVSGSKNAALPILAACLMADGPTRLHRVPRLSDVASMLELLRQLGCRVVRREPTSVPPVGPALNGALDVEPLDESKCEAEYELVKTMRASICVLGPLLAKRGRAVVSVPGGCAIGDRPIDLHLRGLQKLGAEFRFENGRQIATVPGGRLRGAKVYLGGGAGPTVTGTINVMCAAALADGETVLVNAACEPEVADTAALLNKMGARIGGAGTPFITIEGVDRLRGGVEHRVIPDRIETGTFLCAAAITGGRLTLKGADLDHLDAVVDRLGEAGVTVAREDDTVYVAANGRPKPVDLTTQPYPGFPTDLQAQMLALLSLADGMSVVTERIYPERFAHVGELTRMGAHVRKEGAVAVIAGVGHLQGTTVMCSDLRASAALVLAALAARGTTRLDRVYHVDRGYERIEDKLAAVGAEITRVGGDGRPKVSAETYVAAAAEPRVWEPAGR